MHHYTIVYQVWNRTDRRRHLTSAVVRAGSRWGALRAWWRYERQWGSLVDVKSIALNHRGCPRRELPTHWEYTCGQH